MAWYVLEEVKKISLETFAKNNDLHMVVTERDQKIPSYYAYFNGVEIKEGGCLVSSSGNGSTPEEAIKDYENIIAGKHLVVGVFSPNRREIFAPSRFTEK